MDQAAAKAISLTILWTRSNSLIPTMENGASLPAGRRSRKQQTVVDVMDTIGAVTGDGVAGWWEGLSRFGDVERDVPRVIESFRLAGLDSFADMLSQTTFCGEIVATAISRGAEEFDFTTDQEQLLTRIDLYFSKNEPDAREALLRFLPRKATKLWA